MNVTQEDIDDHLLNGSWKHLQKAALEMVHDAEERAGAKMLPKLGGGTRLMLALKHRISDDIDLFIRDPQWIGYLSPRLNDRFENQISKYDEASSSLKLHMQGGEMTLSSPPVCSGCLTSMPNTACSRSSRSAKYWLKNFSIAVGP